MPRAPRVKPARPAGVDRDPTRHVPVKHARPRERVGSFDRLVEHLTSSPGDHVRQYALVPAWAAHKFPESAAWVLAVCSYYLAERSSDEDPRPGQHRATRAGCWFAASPDSQRRKAWIWPIDRWSSELLMPPRTVRWVFDRLERAGYLDCPTVRRHPQEPRLWLPSPGGRGPRAVVATGSLRREQERQEGTAHQKVWDAMIMAADGRFGLARLASHLIYVAEQEHAKGLGFAAHRSRGDLAGRLGIAEPTFTRLGRELVARGWFDRERVARRGGAAVYRWTPRVEQLADALKRVAQDVRERDRRREDDQVIGWSAQQGLTEDSMVKPERPRPRLTTLQHVFPGRGGGGGRE